MPTTYIPRAFGSVLVLGSGVLTQITPNLTMYVRSGIFEVGSTAITPVVDDYTPIFVGDNGLVFAPQFLHKQNNTPVDLNGAVLSTRMTNQYGVTKIWNSGLWAIDDAANGIAYYTYQASDVDTAGMWTVQVQININGEIMHADPRLLQILPTI
jgi:hypothetical protein